MIAKHKKTTQPVYRKPPVVVVLGHVDHGKSSLLEAIKDVKITSKESGGITQHIGAYEVEHPSASSGQVSKITFIDTPGHEAFSAMRSRGAQIADVALLVVDAAQSVQPQTKEAISAIKAAEIPMIVVLSKIDLPTADPEKIKRELLKVDIVVESMGGQVPSVEVSAKEKKGINELLEMILLVSEMQDLTADINSLAQGLVIESYMDGLKGPVATVIVERGTLKVKDVIACPSSAAKVKSLENFQGKAIDKALPGSAAIILGFQTVPGVGEPFNTYKTIEEAETHVEKREIRKEMTIPAEAGGGRKVLNIVLKGDYLGSLEAIEGMLKGLPQDKVILKMLKSEVGDINETDAKLAEMSHAQIVGFRVKISPSVLALLRKDTVKKVRIKTFDIIYELIQEVRNGMEKSLEKEVVREEVGKIKALIIFFGEKNRQIVGGKIVDGEIRKGLKLEVIRADKEIGDGKIVNLQRDKKDVDKLNKGSECGILFEGNVKIEKGDILQAYTEERRKVDL